MKGKIYNYYILALVALLSLVGCSQDTLGDLLKDDGEAKTISFNLQQPAWSNSTRAGVAQADATEITSTNLQLLCFDATGGFVGVAKEITISTEGNKATVPATTKSIHFLLNHPTTFTNTSITLGTNEATAISPNTFTTGTSEKSVVCWGYIPDVDNTDNTTIYLKRNVAKLSVAVGEGTTEITSVGIEAYNDMDKGSIAPFDATDLETPFSSDKYNTTTGVPTFVTIPLDAKQRAWSEVSNNATFNDNYAFIYECKQTADNNVGVIVKVTYNDGTTRYLKISLVDKDGNWFTIIRNNSYKITINYNMPKSAGYVTANEAAASDAVATNTLASVENSEEWNTGSTSDNAIQLLDEGGEDLSSVTLYPNISYTSSNFDNTTTAVEKKFLFWYNTTEDVSSLNANSFAGSSTISGATVTVKSFDTSKKLGTAVMSIPYSAISAKKDNVGTVSISLASNTSVTSNAITVNAAEWSSDFTNGTINYYIDTDNSNSVVITGFDLTSSATSVTNLRVASSNLVPASSSLSAFNNAYIDATPITGLDYWYNNPNSTTASISSSDFAFRGTSSTTSPTENSTTPSVYIMADGIKPYALTWKKGTKPTKSYAYISSYTNNGNNDNFVLNGENFTMFTFNGNGTDTKYTINNISIEYGLKLEGNQGTIKFKTSSQQVITLYATANNAIKITDSNNSNITATSETVTMNSSTLYKYTATLPAGSYTISKGSNSGNVVYIELE